MDWGMLWYDDTSGRSLEEKVSRAVKHYQRKYGQAPTLCLVHPLAKNGTDQVDGVQIEPYKTVGRNCLWIGIGQLQRPTHSARRKKK